MVIDRHQDPRELSSSLPGLFALKNWSALWKIYTLVQNWAEIVGENVAKKSEPAYMQKDTLWVYVESSVLMQHLQSQKPLLLRQINELLPNADIKDIRWEMRPAGPPVKKHKEKRKPGHLPDPEERKAFEAMAATIEDRYCREALMKLWQSFYSR